MKTLAKFATITAISVVAIICFMWMPNENLSPADWVVEMIESKALMAVAVITIVMLIKQWTQRTEVTDS